MTPDSSLPAAPAASLILLVEDEEHLAQGLLFNLEAEGFRTRHESDGRAALDWLLATGELPSAVLLDVMLPGLDGFAVVRALRERACFVPVLMLTARGRTEDVLAGIEAGADDYLPKPFELGVLFARLHALLRRAAWARTASVRALAGPESQPGPVAPGSAVLTLADRVVDFDRLEVRGPGAVVHLTLMEADLLRYLLERPGQIVTRKELLENVWRVHEDTDTRAIDNFVVRLRRYLEHDAAHPRLLLTVRGLGYRYEPAQP